MYKCENCDGTFHQDEVKPGFNPYADWGGEKLECCPHCGMPDMFYEIKEEEDDE